jgi:hypothetical protein
MHNNSPCLSMEENPCFSLILKKSVELNSVISGC